MKLLSIIVPCYNSQDYMDRCLESLLVEKENVEILIIDDGSTDRTAQIADDYAREYPQTIRVIHQENRGHGGALNTGLQHAQGIYLKVVDSDDWLDEGAYRRTLAALENLHRADDPADMILTNFVYEKVGATHKKCIHFRRLLPVNTLFSWDRVKHFGVSHYFLMHSIIYRTELLHECGLKLPEHSFYVDNLYAYVPLPYVKTIYYLNTDLYRYYIGRDDQSVNETVMLSRIKQQIRVNRLLIRAYDPWQFEDDNLREYMLNYINIVTMVTTVLLINSGTDEHLRLKRKLWREIRIRYPQLYQWLCRHFPGYIFVLPGKMGNHFVVFLYRIIKKIWGFN